MDKNTPRSKNYKNNRNKNRNFSKKKKFFRKNFKKPEKSSSVMDHILELESRYMAARKKYYEKYHTPDLKQRDKLERDFVNTKKRLNDYIDNLKGEKKEEFLKIRKELNFDHTYAENHDLDPKEKDVDPTLGDDPHITHEQKQRKSYSDDTEESTGTMEDYLKLKGIEE